MDDRTVDDTVERADDIAVRLRLGASKRSRRSQLIASGIGTAAIVGLLIYFLVRPAPTTFETSPVTQGALTVTVSATGTLKPLNQVDVGAEISGRIVSLHADFNDPVKKGDVLALLDTAELRAKVVQSEAAVANAEATLVENRAKRNRIAALRKSGTSSKEDLDIAQAALDRAEAQVRQARAQAEVDRTNFARAEIRAPIDGIVLDRKVEAGQTVAAMFQTPVLFTLAEDLKRMRLQVDVDEADVGRVREGQTAHFTVDAYTDRQFSATVQQFRNAPQSTEGVVTYPVVLDVENPDLALRPGMTANAEIIAARLDEALLVANGALRFTPPGYAVERVGTDSPPQVKTVTLKRNQSLPPLVDLGAGYGIVWTKGGRTPEPHVLKLGASDGIRTVIEKGDLKPGTQVLIDIARDGP